MILQKWSKGDVNSFTKRIKRLDYLSIDNSYFYDSAEKLIFPQKRSRKKVYILNGKGYGESKDLLRHIRNAFAHNNADIFIRKGDYYFEFMDYNSNRSKQTAYILIPVDMLKQIYELYQEIECSLRSKRKNTR